MDVEKVCFVLPYCGKKGTLATSMGEELYLKTKITTLIIAVTVLFLSATCVYGFNEFPQPTGAVNDFAGVISPQYEGPMKSLAGEILEKTGTPVIVVTVKEIGEENPADYANRLYEAWGIGKKGEDKGVLIFLAVKERRVRIETGYGTEGILPDGLVGDILDRYVVPYLKKDDYDKGLSNAMIAVSSVIAKDANVSLTDAPQTGNRQASPQGKGNSIFSLIMFFVVISLLLGTRQGRRMLPFILLMLMAGGGGRGGGGFGGFGGGFGGFGGGMSGGGGAGRGF